MKSQSGRMVTKKWKTGENEEEEAQKHKHLPGYPKVKRWSAERKVIPEDSRLNVCKYPETSKKYFIL